MGLAAYCPKVQNTQNTCKNKCVKINVNKINVNKMNK